MSATGPGAPPANTRRHFADSGFRPRYRSADERRSDPLLRRQSDRLHGERRISARIFRRRGGTRSSAATARTKKKSTTHRPRAPCSRSSTTTRTATSTWASAARRCRRTACCEAEGHAYIEFIDASAPTPVTVDFTPAPRQGDVLASFSLRGPDVLTTITKPDLTAPGINIYAALDAAENNYGYFSGTSMSSPHMAGAGRCCARFIRDWTPSEVKSALMLTAAATPAREENVATPWTPDDVGSGRVDLRKAALAGFVLDETLLELPRGRSRAWWRSEDAEPRRDAQRRRMRCADAVSHGRARCAMRLPGPSSWTVSVDAPRASTSQSIRRRSRSPAPAQAPIRSSRNGFDANDAQTIVGDRDDRPCRSPVPQFAELVFHEANGAAPDAHMTVAVKGTQSGDGAIGVVCSQGNLHIPDRYADDELHRRRLRDLLRADLAQPFHARSRRLSDHDHVDLDDLRRRPRMERARRSHQLLRLSGRRYRSDQWRRAGRRISGLRDAGSGQLFTTITLPTPIVVNGPGDVLIALTNPAPNVGSRPASADAGPFAGRSWVAQYNDTGGVPDLAAVGLLPNPVALAGFNGNWLIRATGTNASGQPIVLGMPEQN